MTARALSLTNTPVSLGDTTTLEVVVSATETASATAYLKVYDQATTPTASDTPVLSCRFAADETKPLIFGYQANATLWLVASTDFLAGLTAPASAMEVSVIYR